MNKNVSNMCKKVLVVLFGILPVFIMAIILIQIIFESIPAFRYVGTKMFNMHVMWRPVSENPQYGLMPIIAGTLYVSTLAVIFSMLLGIGCALFLNFYVNNKFSNIILSFIDIVAGIPSVIFGFIGLTVVVKVFLVYFNMSAGQSVLSACIVLSIMLIPFVVSSCNESIKTARKKYELSVLSLGLSKEFFILKIIFPAIRKGIVASAIMAFGRGLGETMAVMMVIGNSPIYPKLLGRAQTLPSLTALEMGSIEYGSLHMSVLYAANLVLLVILVIVMSVGYFLKRADGRLNYE